MTIWTTLGTLATLVSGIWIGRRFAGRPWSLDNVTPPWEERPSIVGHLLAKIHDGILDRAADVLPDDQLVRERVGFGWVPGALDGAFGHHAAPGTAEQKAAEVARALDSLMRSASDANAQSLYKTLTDAGALEFIDPLLERLQKQKGVKLDRLHAIAVWLATRAPDREPVKVAVGLLGFVTRPEDRQLLMTVGLHEEFTLYALVALTNAHHTSERDLWQLAKNVSGWGRIQIIEGALSKTDDPEIRAWLLREGYRNDIMEEYTALICAKTGNLLDALRVADPDDELLEGAGNILSALITGRGAPAAGMEEYPDGPMATELYLRHLQHRHLDLRDFVILHTIHDFLEEEDGEARDESLGWPQHRVVLLDLADRILNQSGWEDRVWADLGSDDSETFLTATQSARYLGIDLWPIYFERMEKGDDYWYHVMQTDDPDRIDQVVALAEKRLPLDAIASGPQDQLGLGPAFRDHSALDFVLQDLRRFPGKGWPLIRAGLESPVVRNRNMALRSLASWQREAWPPDALHVLARAIKREPRQETLELLQRVMHGEAVDF